jgi:hypothetical protein
VFKKLINGEFIMLMWSVYEDKPSVNRFDVLHNVNLLTEGSHKILQLA